MGQLTNNRNLSHSSGGPEVQDQVGSRLSTAWLIESCLLPVSSHGTRSKRALWGLLHGFCLTSWSPPRDPTVIPSHGTPTQELCNTSIGSIASSHGCPRRGCTHEGWPRFAVVPRNQGPSRHSFPDAATCTMRQILVVEPHAAVSDHTPDVRTAAQTDLQNIVLNEKRKLN